MSFVDKAEVTLTAGNGGNGSVSFYSTKSMGKGGPDGGDGGNGGDIILVGSNNENTLANFRYQKELRAESGRPGTKARKHGRSAKALLVNLPLGTIVANSQGEVLADLTEVNQQVVIAKGGRGGFGNAHFVSSTRRAPKIAEKGEQGQKLHVTLELKLIADVGLIGLPNAGKSTLLSVISNARPEIADYPFTTLTPNLGMADINKSTSLLFADIPGLVEGAAKGKGLGDEFLRHVERTPVLAHLIDANNEAVVSDFLAINNELSLYNPKLAKRPQLIVLTKIEGMDPARIKDLSQQLAKTSKSKYPVLAISAKSKEGLKDMLNKVTEIVSSEKTKQAKKKAPKKTLPVIRLEDEDEYWKVQKQGSHFVVVGPKIERFAGRTDFDNPYSVQRLRDIMRKFGIMHELIRQGVKVGDRVVIADKGEFTY